MGSFAKRVTSSHSCSRSSMMLSRDCHCSGLSVPTRESALPKTPTAWNCSPGLPSCTFAFVSVLRKGSNVCTCSTPSAHACVALHPLCEREPQLLFRRVPCSPHACPGCRFAIVLGALALLRHNSQGERRRGASITHDGPGLVLRAAFALAAQGVYKNSRP